MRPLILFIMLFLVGCVNTPSTEREIFARNYAYATDLYILNEIKNPFEKALRQDAFDKKYNKGEHDE